MGFGPIRLEKILIIQVHQEDQEVENKRLSLQTMQRRIYKQSFLKSEFFEFPIFYDYFFLEKGNVHMFYSIIFVCLFVCLFV